MYLILGQSTPIYIVLIMVAMSFYLIISVWFLLNLQVGGCHFVYPNATHTRFQHSLGVGHLAKKFAEKLHNENPEKMNKKDIICVMIAGLCHDLGNILKTDKVLKYIPHKQTFLQFTSLSSIDIQLDRNISHGAYIWSLK